MLHFGIVFPKEVAPGTVTMEWAGWFLKDGKVVEDSKFRLVQVAGSGARAEIAAPKLPSDRVRLFAPGHQP
jgi:hypothetical protein